MRRSLRTLAATIALAGGLLTGAVTAAAPNALASGSGQLVNWGSDLCLGIQGSSTASGARALQGTCATSLSAGNGTQSWHIQYSELINQNGLTTWAVQLQNGTGNCLGVQGSSHASGAQVVQGTCGNVSTCPYVGSSVAICTQLWFPISTVTQLPYGGDPGSGHYGWVNAGSLMVMGVAGSSLASGARVVQGNPLGNQTTPTQQWGDFNLGRWI